MSNSQKTVQNLQSPAAQVSSNRASGVRIVHCVMQGFALSTECACWPLMLPHCSLLHCVFISSSEVRVFALGLCLHGNLPAWQLTPEYLHTTPVQQWSFNASCLSCLSFLHTHAMCVRAAVKFELGVKGSQATSRHNRKEREPTLRDR